MSVTAQGGPSAPRLVMLNYTLNGGAYTIAIDASINEQHGAKASLSKHKVEVGADITDNVTPEPDSLTLQCAVTDSPIYPTLLQPSNAGLSNGTQQQMSVAIPSGQGTRIVDFVALGFAGADLGRVASVFTALVEAVKGGAIFQVITTIKTYTDLICTSFDCPRNAQNAHAIMFTLEFNQAVVAYTSTTDAPAPSKQKSNRGPKAAAPATPAVEQTAQQKRKSLLGAETKAFTGFVSALGGGS